MVDPNDPNFAGTPPVDPALPGITPIESLRPSDNELHDAGSGTMPTDSQDVFDLEDGDDLANFSNRYHVSVTEVRALNPGAIDEFGNIVPGTTRMVVPK